MSRRYRRVSMYEEEMVKLKEADLIKSGLQIFLTSRHHKVHYTYLSSEIYLITVLLPTRPALNRTSTLFFLPFVPPRKKKKEMKI
ncbi:MAG: hypothetical protein NC122_02600 [Faecalibacterium sp.]|nr:hypothetical protein [Ruminococcus sp.]MCM1391967.1 hypothetical protein [Ruminococcus sp.]MCM1485074.1 hypothetical protein [Faecalibacterium sp.]